MPCRSPLDRLLEQVGLRRHDAHDGRRTVSAFVGLTWLPFVALELVVLAATGHLDPIFRAPGVHIRLLVAIPAYLEAEAIFATRTSVCIGRILDGRLVAPEQHDALRAMVRRSARLRDSVAAEIVLLVIAIGIGQLTIWNGQAGLFGYVSVGISAGLIWYGSVAFPVFLFLLFRWIWRWAVWAHLLWKLSRFPLRLLPMHPDRAAGLAFLVGPSMAFSLVLFGSSAVIAGTFAGIMLAEGTHLRSFGPEIIVLVIAGELLALGPLLVFYAQLVAARFAGHAQYGALGIDYDRLFQQKWIESGDTEGLLGTSDIQSLADIQNAYGGLDETRAVPFGKREILLVALALVLPMVPLLLIEFPVEELLTRLVGALA
ncbi:hypothetical protein [Vulgatibacter incomptus]|uniref:hypothetical protein n=1 Tax=Vulgatibacter incomptus TaxID=1391653 RepID=UPI0012F901AC|nr:hypothetical protein [Vulgatibacter incomptus]